MPAPALTDTAAALCVVLIFLVPCAGAGLALINAGLGRSRSAAHLMMSSLCVVAIAATVYFVCGFAWQGFVGGPSHSVSFSGKSWDWIAAGPLFLRHQVFEGSPASLAALLGMFSVGLAAMIPLGSGADRWRLGACCASTAVLAGWTYPLFAHWVWGGGWLAQLGTNYGLGQGFVDTGGASTIQAVGGLTALSIAWILGARRGKYTHDGMPSAIPGHNGVFVLFGCLLAWVGWLGLNSAGAILFNGAPPGRVVLVAINTTLTAAVAGLTAAAITHTRYGKPDASLTANGWIGGLAASSAGCAFVNPAAAAAIGLAAGVLVTFSVGWFEVQMSVDDPGGSISAHAMGGLWGVLSVGLFAEISASGHPGQWLAQLVGIATLIGFVLPLTYGLNWLLDRVYSQRVAAEGERQGMDLYELGAGAYPEFVTHSEEFTER
ncbi:MAG: ammonium transporter [Acidobacteriia bacterium]|nr:ammonium transporter [Terriglobia bacterium]